jgi:putative glutamine amidotransferase
MSSKKRPLIGITCLALRENDWTELSLGLWKDCIFRDYTQSVAAAGGIPVGIPILEDKGLIADLLARVDGVILTGGPDIYPYLYSQEMRPGMGNSEYKSDHMEIEIARHTFENKQPTLGICRGIQVMAVAAGGRLIQDIKSEVDNPLSHWQNSSKDTYAHQVEIVENSKLNRIAGSSKIWVNSHHHQAIRAVLEEFQITAHSGDGVIEGIEHPQHPFYVGVQWHPEGTTFVDKPSLRLFEALVSASA